MRNYKANQEKADNRRGQLVKHDLALSTKTSVPFCYLASLHAGVRQHNMEYSSCTVAVYGFHEMLHGCRDRSFLNRLYA